MEQRRQQRRDRINGAGKWNKGKVVVLAIFIDYPDYSPLGKGIFAVSADPPEHWGQPLQFCAQHADYVVGGDDAGEFVVFVDDWKSH
jgi:hypothetical protein